MLRASFGEEAEIRAFFQLLLGMKLFAIDRHQETRMAHEPEYPSPFFGLLGVRDGDRTVIPLFTSKHLIRDWCGQEFQHSHLPINNILERSPSEWWLVINPGQEVEKEISPWEVNLLRAGPEGIEEIVKEHLASEYTAPLGIEPVADAEFARLREGFLKWVPSQPKIRSMRLARELSRDSEGREQRRLLLGLEIDTDNPTELSLLQEEAQKQADVAQIGDENVKVIVGKYGMQSLALSVLASVEPFWQVSVLE